MRGIARWLCVFALPIVVAALVVAGVTGHVNCTGDGRPAPGGQNDTVKAPRPFQLNVIYYSRDFVDVMKVSRKRGRDPLASFDVFKSACQDASAGWPFVIKRVKLRYEDWIREMHFTRASESTIVIDQTNFDAQLPLLKELQTLILEGGGAGRGKLPKSQRCAEPVNREKWHILEQPEFDYL